MSTVLRQAYLRLCKGLGKKRITSKSGIGHPFVCHLGDFLGENPFYNREAFRTELEVCASWLRTENKPIVFDVGANVGFWSTHLAQMIDTQSPEIYAFEPVPSTFCKLRESVEDLSLESSVFPIAVAITDRPRSLRLSYSPQDSLFAQIADHGLNTRVGDQMVHAVGTP